MSTGFSACLFFFAVSCIVGAMNILKQSLKPLDVVILLAAATLTGLCAFKVYAQGDAAAQVLIQCNGKKWIYPLNAEETVSVKGPLGSTVIRIHNKAAWIQSSPCPNQLCVQAGRIKKSGDWVACLPNKVFMVIEGTENEQDGVDIISR
jgi:hypothetical protein